MPKLPLFVLVLITILIVSYLVYSQAPKKYNSYTPGAWREADTAVNQATHLFEQKKVTVEDLETGPCLSNALIPGWVADIVHSPRQPIDDLPENQCSTYLEGTSKHFVELDTGGSVIRVK